MHHHTQLNIYALSTCCENKINSLCPGGICAIAIIVVIANPVCVSMTRGKPTEQVPGDASEKTLTMVLTLPAKVGSQL
jgi:hypothetical protein